MGVVMLPIPNRQVSALLMRVPHVNDQDTNGDHECAGVLEIHFDNRDDLIKAYDDLANHIPEWKITQTTLEGV